ncbi:hypothetical protein SmJEL517_g02236 [Synchytrium microbalum]|uniref:Alpha-soluble NSF attachment protein n=1 Tax=Synchytrium microbalum TaxID=1806994 RepID=A0A507C2C4_9FUNG|nr:uncharacterized protein SmJEL517_g02236 [Synchytrium microbalum]TPX35277.1 hypothetical protein SmJEL517_g02236 [Synchytrium microbalum]
MFLSKQEQKAPSTVTGVFKTGISLLTTGRPALPEFKVTNYVFFSIVTVEDGRSFLGIFDQWFAWQEPVQQNSNSSNGKEEQAEALKERAMKLKTQKSYGSAAQTYRQAAQLYEGGGSLGEYEAAVCYEEAYKCFKVAKSSELALDCLEAAASRFSNRDSTRSRAARLYESAASNLKAQRQGEKAAQYFGRASSLYEPGETQSLLAKAQEAETLAEFSKFSSAIVKYRELIQESRSVESLKFSMPMHIFSAILCALQLDDWSMVAKLVGDGKASSSMFEPSTECRFVESLIQCHDDGDAGEFVRECSNFERTHSLIPWKSRCLATIKDNMSRAASSIR